MTKKSASSNNKVVATNRKARHNYTILDTYEAGIVLMGTEVKSLREGQASLADAFATVDDGEIWLRNVHIAEYHHGTWTNHAPRRNRKLLLHRKQIDNLIGKIRDGNLTLVPLSIYFTDGKVKVELALARGKQAHDKRQDLARRDAQREVIRELGPGPRARSDRRVWILGADREPTAEFRDLSHPVGTLVAKTAPAEPLELARFHVMVSSGTKGAEGLGPCA